jgi:hypothetical protein
MRSAGMLLSGSERHRITRLNGVEEATSRMDDRLAHYEMAVRKYLAASLLRDGKEAHRWYQELIRLTDEGHSDSPEIADLQNTFQTQAEEFSDAIRALGSAMIVEMTRAVARMKTLLGQKSRLVGPIWITIDEGSLVQATDNRREFFSLGEWTSPGEIKGQERIGAVYLLRGGD